MQVTNNLDLPPQLVRVLTHPDMRYSRGDSDISITQLLSGPRQVMLREAHRHEVVEDISDNIFRLLGSVLHKILELGADEGDGIVERRVATEIKGWKVSGGVDVQIVDPTRKAIKIIDWKLTSVMTVMAGRPEWSAQMNCYAALLRREGWTIMGLENIVVLRDWSRARAGVPTYPKAAVVRMEQPVWAAEDAEAFLTERVDVHQAAVAGEMLGDPMPECTPEERWQEADTYAVMAPGGTRAKRVSESREEMEAWIKESGGAKKDSLRIVKRPGQPRRCLNYCLGAPWCDQWAKDRDAMAASGNTPNEEEVA